MDASFVNTGTLQRMRIGDIEGADKARGDNSLVALNRCSHGRLVRTVSKRISKRFEGSGCGQKYEIPDIHHSKRLQSLSTVTIRLSGWHTPKAHPGRGAGKS